MLSHEDCMALAIAQAHIAQECGEVPVGAVVVKNGKVIGAGHNRTLVDCDPTAHAEIVAIRAASKSIGNHRLCDCSLYVTLEPCAMCMGCILHSRLEHVYFGAYDPKAGACGSVLNLPELRKINHHCQVHGGVSQDVCSHQLKSFFQRRRLEHRLDFQPLREDALRLPDVHLDKWMTGCKPQYWTNLRSADGLRVRGWASPNVDSNARTLVLCLHGLSSWSYLYRDLLLANLPAALAVWAIDLPGHGGSDKTKQGQEFEASFQLAVLNEIVASCGFDSVYVLAHGTGCTLAVELARMNSGVVRSLILCNPVLSNAQVCDGAGVVAKLPRSLRQLNAWFDTVSGGRSEFSTAMCAPYPNAGHLRGILQYLQYPSHNTHSSNSFSFCDVPVMLHVGAPYVPRDDHAQVVSEVHQNADFFLGLPGEFTRLIDLDAINGHE
jgi:tRNA(adenine34) deaminase